MDEGERERIEAEAKQLVEWFDDIEIATLKTHTAIHRKLTAKVAEKRGVPVASLRRLSFLAAAKAVHPKNNDLFSVLQILNDARNVVAHEDNTGEVLRKLARLGRSIKGPTYNENPPSVAAARSQVEEILHFVHVWATMG